MSEMDNQQLYYTYCSFDNSGKYYIGYTKKPIESGYKGSYTCKKFKPVGRLDLYSGERIIAMWLEHNYHRIWNVSRNPNFANKSLANIWSTKGFSHSCGMSNSHREKISNSLLNSKKLKESRANPEFKEKISKALKSSSKFQDYSKSEKTRRRRSEEKLKLYLENPEVKLKISESRKASEKVQKTMKSVKYKTTMSEAMKNSEKHKQTVNSKLYRENLSKRTSNWYKNNPEKAKIKGKISGLSNQINNRLRHLFKFKHYKNLEKLSNEQLVSEVQRLEEDLVGYKRMIAETRNNP